jgi:hypothetical protein
MPHLLCFLAQRIAQRYDDGLRWLSPGGMMSADTVIGPLPPPVPEDPLVSRVFPAM